MRGRERKILYIPHVGSLFSGARLVVSSTNLND